MPRRSASFLRATLKKVLVQFEQHSSDAPRRCPGPGRVYAHSHRSLPSSRVSFVQAFDLREASTRRSKRAGNGIAAHEVIVGEERLEHRPCDQMLRHHCHQVLFLQGWIQRLLQVGQEGVEVFPQGDPLRALNQAVDANADAVGDLGHVRGPLGPVLAVAALLDDAGVDRAGGYLVHQVQGQLGNAVALILLAAAVDDDDAVGGRLVQVQRVDLQVEAVVVAAQGPQHVPHHLEGLHCRPGPARGSRQG